MCHNIKLLELQNSRQKFNNRFSLSGYVLSAPPHYALPAMPPPIPMSLPFLTRELLSSNGRPNYNASYSYKFNGDDLPCNVSNYLPVFCSVH